MQANPYQDVEIVFVNIKDWDSPVTEQYQIRSIPAFIVYSPDGAVVTKGPASQITDWLANHYPQLL